MSKTIAKLPGRFRYRADAIPKGHRVARRILLHAPALYEIQAVDAADVKAEAVRVRTYAGNEVSYTLYDGRLWRPANPANPVSLADYARMVETWPTQDEQTSSIHNRQPDPRKLAQRTDPIAFSHDYRDDVQWPSRGDFTLHAEEDFQGRIVTSDRRTALPRHQAAARHVLLIGGEIHFAAPEPVWDAGYGGIVRLVAPRVGMNHYDHYALKDSDYHGLSGYRMFAPGRRDEALAFAAIIEPDRPHPIEGEVLALDSEFAPPPVMARSIQSCFYGLFRSEFEKLFRHLSPDSIAAFGALQGAAATLTSHSLGDLERDPTALVSGLRSILADMNGFTIPDNMHYQQRYVRNAIEPVLQRADFEDTLKPRLTPEDDRSLSDALTA